MSLEGGMLITKAGTPLPLLGVDITVDACDTAARVTVVQQYANAEKVPIEALYSFPLEEGSALCGFDIVINDRHITGKVMEKDKAFEVYDEAMAQGQSAFLLDQDRPNIFSISVGNLAPGDKAKVSLQYVTTLDSTEDGVRLALPTTISPRYIPADHARTMDPAALDHITPPVSVDGVSYGLRLTVNYTGFAPLRAVESPSPLITTELDGARARITLVSDTVAMDQDFVLNLRLADPFQPRVLVAPDPTGGHVAQINFRPAVPSGDRPATEVVFLLDCSGSMGGESIDQARSALQLCLRSLQEGDTFNIVCFGSTHQSLFPAPVPYSQATLDKASEAVATMDANLGGTEILAPLTAVLAAPAERPRAILLLTDGQVGNEDQIIALAARQSKTRIFAFGIGRGASELLIRGLARVTGGAAEFIFPGERIETKVLRQFGRLGMPLWEEIRLEWAGLEPDLVAPVTLHQLYGGQPVTILAR